MRLNTFPLFEWIKREIFLLMGLLSLTACAALRPAPFRSFESSVAVAQKGLETEMARDVEWTRESDVNALADAKNAPLSDHMLKEVSGYAWSTPVTAPHWETRQTLRALEQINAAFLGYAKLLTRVAEGRPHESAESESLAGAINQSLRDAQETLAGLEDKDKLPLAGASAFSSESLLKIKNHHRAKDLRAAVLENQPWVESYAAQCLSLIDLIRADLKAAYADRLEAIHARWDDKRTPGRNTLARSIFNLNEEYVDAMASLKALALFYNGVPMAHRNLSDGLVRRSKPPKALTDLAHFADRVARLTKDLEKVR